jgi:hypothetical protein
MLWKREFSSKHRLCENAGIFVVNRELANMQSFPEKNWLMLGMNRELPSRVW